MIDFKVSVRCMTYNQASYIVDALNGFCMQQTSFPYVCCILDDASTDGEQNVIRKYLEDYFDLNDNSVVRNEETDDYVLTFAQHKNNRNCYFAVFYLKYNHYKIWDRKYQYISQWEHVTKYIAMCEGDDYWTDSLKLQSQVDTLENDDSVGLVYTKAKKLDNRTGTFIEIIGERFNSIDEILIKNRVPTVTACYRKKLYDIYTEMILKDLQGMSLGDYPMWIFFAMRSKAVFINKEMAIYRVLKESAAHSKSTQKMIRFYTDIYKIRMYYTNMFPESVRNLQKVIANIEDSYEWSKYRVFQSASFPIEYVVSKNALKKLSLRHKLIYLLNKVMLKFGYSL